MEPARETKDDGFKIRCTAAQKLRMKKAADKAERALSDWARLILVKQADVELADELDPGGGKKR